MILERIDSPADLKGLSASELEMLADELRATMIATLSQNGGHLASNLGVVELSVALHRVFDSPRDKIVWDVGHQSYVHKLLTGRRERFDTLRKFGGLSGFTSRKESPHDPFGAGHSSTSISAAAGIAAANKLSGDQSYTIAVVGDGAFTNGMIYEALNNCADKERLIIILNENEMSISPNVGGISRYFSRVRVSKRYFRFKHGLKRFFGSIPVIGNALVGGSRRVKNLLKRLVVRQNFFELLGLTYYGPLDGHNMKHLELVLNEAKNDGGAAVLHVCTKKGKGFTFAEESPDVFHSVGKFCPDDGILSAGGAGSFSAMFGKLLTERAEKDESICAITAAMCGGTGLETFAERFPVRFFDVGIAEGHAMTFAAGLASQGKRAVFAVYSTFFQRAYDQLLHDAAIQGLPVLLALDRAGLVAEDGPTHHGVFDVALLNSVPGVAVYAPANQNEFAFCLDEALAANTASAIRYAKGSPEQYEYELFDAEKHLSSIDFGEKPEVALVTYGRLTKNALDAAELLRTKGIAVRLIKLLRIKPLDMAELTTLLDGCKLVYMLEEVVQSGSVGEHLFARLAADGCTAKLHIRSIGDGFVQHGDLHSLFGLCGFLPEQVADEITALLGVPV